jgi:hypothetical protein
MIDSGLVVITSSQEGMLISQFGMRLISIDNARVIFLSLIEKIFAQKCQAALRRLWREAQPHQLASCSLFAQVINCCDPLSKIQQFWHQTLAIDIARFSKCINQVRKMAHPCRRRIVKCWWECASLWHCVASFSETQSATWTASSSRSSLCSCGSRSLAGFKRAGLHAILCRGADI